MNGSHRQGPSASAPRARGLFLLALLTLVGLLVGSLGGGSQATAAAEKVTICHATSSEKNPYVKISVNAKAVDGQGKNDHTSHEDDIIPAPAQGCPGDDAPGNSDNKVDICHVTGSANNPVVMINVSENAVQAHIDHGDYLADAEDGCEITPPPPPGPNTEGDPTKAPASATVTETASVQGAAPSRQAARACSSRRAFRIRIRSKRRDPVVSATVSVNGKRVASRKGSRVTAPVVLRGLAKGTYAVKITATTRRGRKLSGTRRYKTCTPKSLRKSIPLL
jgi:hypothetical protein